jgi:hypothetical protein
MRFTLLPDPAFIQLGSRLEQKMEEAASLITSETFDSFADDLMLSVLRSEFEKARADEGSIWLVDSQQNVLIPVYNTGPNAETIVGRFFQPLTSGLISMVFANQQAFCENDMRKNPGHDKSLDTQLDVHTESMIAVPFYYARKCRGVISCVRFWDPTDGEPPSNFGFDERSIREVSLASALLERFFTAKLVSRIIGWEVE